LNILDERVASGKYRVGIDIGGTFTDFTVTDQSTGRIRIEKTLTTPERPELAVYAGLEKLATAVPDLLPAAHDIIHATTLVTNVILEGKGSKTGLLTTKGFSDILEIAREVRYTVFDMFIRFPPPLVPRRLRVGVSERTLSDGSVIEALDEGEVRAAAALFRREGVKAIAICFLHSYRNAANERRAAEILRAELPGVDLSLSHEVLPEPKEFERTSTTVIDAYVKRVASAYIERLDGGLKSRGFERSLFLMLSNGGTATVETAKRFPVQILESGPAAGVEAVAFFGRLIGLDTMLAFDMGGTTAKLCIIENGQAARTRAFEVGRVHRFKAGSGYPVSLPVYDLLEIGAGGGSIARISNLGLLQVGPESAASDPGPACYGLGGEQPTVTDADLVLGYLNPGYFLGGEMPLDRAAAERAIETKVAAPSGLDAAAAAAGIFGVVSETMAAAARIYITDKGKSGGDLTLVASGGAGPVHAVELARKLGIRRVVIPPFSGVMSSLGLLAAPIAIERSRTLGKLLAKVDLGALEAVFQEIERDAAALLPERAEAQYKRSLDLRYAGQDYPLEIQIERPISVASAVADWSAAFLKLYETLYGKVDEENSIEVATARIQVQQRVPAPHIARPNALTDGAPKAFRDIYVTASADFRRAPVFERALLQVGQIVVGPAVIEERESTTIIGSGDRIVVDAHGCLIVEVQPTLPESEDTSRVEATTVES
jgi:N-methylhydantoinase A